MNEYKGIVTNIAFISINNAQNERQTLYPEIMSNYIGFRTNLIKKKSIENIID